MQTSNQGRLCICGTPTAPGLGPVPLVQCSCCLDFRKSKRYCKDVSDKLYFEGSSSVGWAVCRHTDTAHITFSSEFGLRHNWDDIVRSKVAFLAITSHWCPGLL
ncbi:hypothetical protein EVAR_14059_1 [Eumeta japonica]|uniref:Uncharacterized protein n=1 Tax=Eumeta variegata TaxID=151549 RepID=A0A4C1UNT9_EUMVA|nr:hypothetical protein EVAR_14059_1 [Eumeta japonica]